MSFYPLALSLVLSISSLPFAPSLPQSWGGFEPQSQTLGTAYHCGEEKALGTHWARTPYLHPLPFSFPPPVIVLADAPHSSQSLQVVVGLAGAEAVQGLAAPRVPIGGGEVDGHLVDGFQGLSLREQARGWVSQEGEGMARRAGGAAYSIWRLWFHPLQSNLRPVCSQTNKEGETVRLSHHTHEGYVGMSY